MKMQIQQVHYQVHLIHQITVQQQVHINYHHIKIRIMNNIKQNINNMKIKRYHNIYNLIKLKVNNLIMIILKNILVRLKIKKKSLIFKPPVKKIIIQDILIFKIKYILAEINRVDLKIYLNKLMIYCLIRNHQRIGKLRNVLLMILKILMKRIQKYHCLTQKKKQGKSIKRRIYDALNVLIAVGMLQKKGKKISLVKNQWQQKQKQMKAEIEREQISKKKLIENKKKKIQKIKNQHQCIKKLLQRNSIKKSQDIQIKFPFIIGQKIINNQNKYIISIKQLYCSDLDAIQKLNICIDELNK